jgi:hypothetical protein
MPNPYKSSAAVIERKNKVFMFLQAANKALSVHEIASSPMINGSGRGIASTLRSLKKDGKVRLEGKLWAVQHADNKAEAKMYFVMNLQTRSFQLDIGGVRLPLIVEP